MFVDILPRVPFLRRAGESTNPAVASLFAAAVENVAPLHGRLVGQASRKPISTIVTLGVQVSTPTRCHVKILTAPAGTYIVLNW